MLGGELTFPVHSVKVYFQGVFYRRGYGAYDGTFGAHPLVSDVKVFNSSNLPDGAFGDEAGTEFDLGEFELNGTDGKLMGSTYLDNFQNKPFIYTLNLIVEVYSDRGLADPFLEYKTPRKIVLGHFLNSDGTLFIPAPDFELWGSQFG